MTPLDAIYTGRFFRTRKRLAWRAPIVCRAISEVLSPSSVIDVGCAIGDLVGEFLSMGILALGMEGSESCKDYLDRRAIGSIIFHDLRMPFLSWMPRWDLCTCFEVAEHIEPEFATQFVTNLCALSDRILMSAAPPGQGGHYHVNCREKIYWMDRFSGKGYGYEGKVVDLLQNAWKPWAQKPGIKAYYQNLLYFERKEGEK